MKRFYILGAMLALAVSCNKPTPEPTQEEVTVKLTYTLDTSIGENMTKAGDEELWDKFYAKIKTGEFVAPTYNLTFVEKTSAAKYEFNGSWDKEEFVTLKTGEYVVTGSSTADGDYIQEKASITFNTGVTVTAAQTTITLPAEYSCFLLAFAKSDITSLTNHVSYSYMGGKSSKTLDFYFFEDHYYAFSRKLYDSTYPKECYILGKRESDSKFYIYTENLGFQAGKYYFYTDASSLYDVPEMEQGE